MSLPLFLKGRQPACRHAGEGGKTGGHGTQILLPFVRLLLLFLGGVGVVVAVLVGDDDLDSHLLGDDGSPSASP